MFADLLPPQTFVFDWEMLGFPSGLVAFLAVLASMFSAAVALARRHVRVGWILLVCAVVYLAANLIAYQIGRNFQSLWRTPRDTRNVDENPAVKNEIRKKSPE
jgi:thiosulfate reductase cytochrome b subunit